MLSAEDLLLQVREQADEFNTEDISDPAILRALSRAQQKLVAMSTAKSSCIFVTTHTLSPSDFTDGVAVIPSIFPAYKILGVEAVYEGRNSVRLQPRAITALAPLKSAGNISGAALVYAIAGNKITVAPGLNSVKQILLILQSRPLPLVKSLGRISDISNVSSNVFSIVEWNSELTTEIDELNCFLNVVNPLTGEVKGTVQVSALDEDTNEITVSSAPLRQSVFGLSVADSLEDIDLSVDDEICLARGTCIPYLMEDFSNYLIAFTVLELKRRLGENVESEYANLKDMEEEVKRSWAGTPGTMRVKHTNKNWLNSGRWFRNQ